MNRKIIFLANILFWVLTISIDVLPVLTFDNASMIQSHLVRVFASTALLAVVFYAFYFFFAPFLLFRKKFLLFFIVMFIFIIIYSFILLFALIPIYKIFLPVGETKEVPMKLMWLSCFAYSFVYALFGTMFRFTLDWFQSSQKQKELEKQNISSELALLRSQINPHFLFNTLNNINSYITRDPDKSSFGIIKLSEIMRYMLYDSNTDKVFLNKEIDYINSFIALQKLRIKDPDYIDFQIEGKTEGHLLPPMILIPFVENAFKHGKKTEVSPGIYIYIKVFEGNLHFIIRNYINLSPKEITDAGGFGLKNIKRRLDLLYGKDYSLDTYNDGNEFKIELKFKLYNL